MPKKIGSDPISTVSPSVEAPIGVPPPPATTPAKPAQKDELAGSQAPSVTTARANPKPELSAPVTGKAFRGSEDLLHEATKNLVGGVDVGLAIFTAFISLGVSIRRLPGKIEPDEARGIVDAARKLPAAQQRIIAGALEKLVARNAVSFPVDRERDANGKVVSRTDGLADVLKPFISEILGTTPLSPAEAASARLLAAVDEVRFSIEPKKRADLALKDNQVTELTQALAAAPAELAKEARALLKKHLSATGYAKPKDPTPALAELTKLVAR